jgi:hypothetical protein
MHPYVASGRLAWTMQGYVTAYLLARFIRIDDAHNYLALCTDVLIACALLSVCITYWQALRAVGDAANSLQGVDVAECFLEVQVLLVRKLTCCKQG